MIMNRVWAMPSADTFDVIPIHNFVQKYLHESTISIDPFARNKRWATYANDLNPQTQAEFHLEALEFMENLIEQGIKADLAIFDPPYSSRQIMESYQGIGRKVLITDTQNPWREWRNALAQLLTDDAVVLSFGWNSAGMGKKHGFELVELLLVNHGSAHNDTICIAERRQQMRLL